MADELQPFPWYGGKFSHLDFILPRLPDQPIYVEPFAGSAAVLLSRPPAGVETYNDLDRDVVTFFRVLRDRPDELLPRLEATPYSREEYRVAIAAAGNENLPDIERARLFYVRASQVYSGLAQYATEGRWSYSTTSSNRGMANAVSAWWSNIDGLDAIVDRLRKVQLEHKPAIDVVERYDDEDALVYCDPPYPLSARGTAGCGTADPVAYSNEMTEDDHRELAEVLRECDAKIAVSSYRNDLYDEVFDGWHCAEAEPKKLRTKNGAELGERTEALYTNYDPTAVSPPSEQQTLQAVTDGGYSG